jgi:hypothetical protein
MRLPGFTAEAGLNRLGRRYDAAGTFTIAGPRTGVEMANIIPGGCNPNASCGTYNCTAVWIRFNTMPRQRRIAAQT